MPVRVIATRRIARFLSIESKPAQAVLARTVTDAAGFYEFHVSKAREYDYYFLRFYDSTGFDAVKFAVPDDVEITRLITRRRPVVVDQVLQHAPEWEAVQRLRSLYGPDSLRGKIVRDLGVPDRTERAFTDAGVERETWWFDAAGVAYVIEDGEVVDKREFQAEAESHSIANRQ